MDFIQIDHEFNLIVLIHFLLLFELISIKFLSIQ